MEPALLSTRICDGSCSGLELSNSCENSIELTIELHKWILSTIGCFLIGLAGILPFFIFRPKTRSKFENGKTIYKAKDEDLLGIEPKKLNRLLSFAVGSLLGHAFLHLLPEAWERSRGDTTTGSIQYLELWILIGILSFVVCEKLLSLDTKSEMGSNVVSNNNNSNSKPIDAQIQSPVDFRGSTSRNVTGYLNLLANVFDNFTHGLAVGGSFIISTKVGFLTTLAILFHEIPHEMADYGILLRAGFNPLAAAKAQLSTACVGLLGAFLALGASSMQTQIGNYTWWILPYTGGCFITISMTNLLPDIMKERDSVESLKQMLFLILGILIMGIVTCVHI